MFWLAKFSLHSAYRNCPPLLIDGGFVYFVTVKSRLKIQRLISVFAGRLKTATVLPKRDPPKALSDKDLPRNKSQRWLKWNLDSGSQIWIQTDQIATKCW